jgi:hypothetical protein
MGKQSGAGAGAVGDSATEARRTAVAGGARGEISSGVDPIEATGVAGAEAGEANVGGYTMSKQSGAGAEVGSCGLRGDGDQSMAPESMAADVVGSSAIKTATKLCKIPPPAVPFGKILNPKP